MAHNRYTPYQGLVQIKMHILTVVHYVSEEDSVGTPIAVAHLSADGGLRVSRWGTPGKLLFKTEGNDVPEIHKAGSIFDAGWLATVLSLVNLVANISTSYKNLKK